MSATITEFPHFEWLPLPVQARIVEMAMEDNIPGHGKKMYGNNYRMTFAAIANWCQPGTQYDGFTFRGVYSSVTGTRVAGFPTMAIMRLCRFSRLVGFEYFKRHLLSCSIHPFGGVGHRVFIVKGIDEFIDDLRFKLGITYEEYTTVKSSEESSGETSGERLLDSSLANLSILEENNDNNNA